MLAIELVADPATKEPAPELAQAVDRRGLQRGLLLLKAGVYGNCIRVLVPARDHRRRARRGARRLGRGARRTPRLALRSVAAAGTDTRSMVVSSLIADRYELEELVGTGGMSSVYRAHDPLLERNVALKILHEQLRRRRGVRRAVPPRGARGRAALAPEHRHGDRPRRGGGPPVHRLRVIDGENLKELIERGGPAAGRGACSSSALEIGARARVRARAGPRPPRREAAERAPGRRRGAPR